MFKQTHKDTPPQPIDFGKPADAAEAPPASAPAPESQAAPPAMAPNPAPASAMAAPQAGTTAFSSMAPARPAGSSAASVIAPDLLIKGGIEGRGEIQLQGKAWGDVKVERLMVGEAATLEGSVEAVVVEVRGRVTGSISARQVKLHPSAKVEGDITYEQLSIDNGAFFEGRCIKSKGDAAAATPGAAPAASGGKTKGDAAPAPAPNA
jgi:cytoskeletal protein CcmA (bactofilin family)